MTELLNWLKNTHPAAYESLSFRYPEAFFAIEDGSVSSFYDSSDVDVEEELLLLRADLVELELLSEDDVF